MSINYYVLGKTGVMKRGWAVQLMSLTAAPLHLKPCEDARKSILRLREQELLEL